MPVPRVRAGTAPSGPGARAAGRGRASRPVGCGVIPITGVALVPARCRRGGGLASVQPGQDGCAAECPMPERGGRGLAPSRVAGRVGGSGGEGDAALGAAVLGRFKFWQRVILGLPREEGPGSRGCWRRTAACSAPPFPSRSPCRAAPGRVQVRRRGRAAPSLRRGGPASRGGGAAAEEGRAAGESRTFPVPALRVCRARVRGARRGRRVRGRAGGARGWVPGASAALPSVPEGRSRVALATQGAAFAGGLAESLRGPLKHRLPEK